MARENPESPWVVKSRKTLVSPSPSSSFQSRHGKSSEASNGEFAPTTVQSVCVAGPQKESSSVAAAHSLKAFEGLCCTQLPPWRSRGFLVMNTFRGCRQTVVAIPTGLQGTYLPTHSFLWPVGTSYKRRFDHMGIIWEYCFGADYPVARVVLRMLRIRSVR